MFEVSKERGKRFRLPPFRIDTSVKAEKKLRKELYTVKAAAFPL
jgi:hypothetical protein